MFGSNSMYTMWFFVLFVLIVVAMIVAKDAANRGHNGALWALIVIFLPMMGIFLYLIFISINPTFDSTLNRPQTTPRYTPPVSRNTQTYQAPAKEYLDEYSAKFCVSCGKGNIETADYCIGCGSSIPEFNKYKN